MKIHYKLNAFISEGELLSYVASIYNGFLQLPLYLKKISYDLDSALVEVSYLTFYGLDIRYYFYSPFRHSLSQSSSAINAQCYLFRIVCISYMLKNVK